MKFLNLLCYFFMILLNWIKVSSVNLCSWLYGTNSSVVLFWKPLRTQDHMWYCCHEYSSLVQLWVQIITSSVFTCWLAFRRDGCQHRKCRRDSFVCLFNKSNMLLFLPRHYRQMQLHLLHIYAHVFEVCHNKSDYMFCHKFIKNITSAVTVLVVIWQ